MSHSQHVYHTVFRRLRGNLPRERVTRLRNLSLLVTALCVAGSCQVTRLADHLPVAGHKDSRVQRLRRFLMNKRLHVGDVYRATARAILRLLSSAPVILIVDRTTLGNWLNILTVSVAYRGRALPLAWKVLKKQGQFKRCHIQALLRWVQTCLPAGLTPTQMWVVADREFQDVALQATVEHELGWHYIQRITHNLWLYPEHGQPFQPNQLGLQPGQQHQVPHVRVTRQQAGPAHFLAYWAPGEAEPWYLLSDQPVGRHTWRGYRRRFWTEPMYRDFKSYGWDIETSRITDPQRFARLLLGIALAYVWLVQLASHIIKAGRRRLVDRTARRTLSYFRIGQNWLWRLLTIGSPIYLPNSLYL